MAITLITPLPPASDSPAPYSDFRASVLEISERFKIPVFDSWKVFFGQDTVYDNSKTAPFLDDSDSLNADGNDLFWEKLDRFLEGVYFE